MSDAIKNITIIDSPFQPAMETAFGIVLMVRSPRSKSSVTVIVNPAAEDYQTHTVDSPPVRQGALMRYTEETQELFFDFDGAAAHHINIVGRDYEIRLMAIEHVNQDGQDFPTYEFMVSQR